MFISIVVVLLVVTFLCFSPLSASLLIPSFIFCISLALSQSLKSSLFPSCQKLVYLCWCSFVVVDSFCCYSILFVVVDLCCICCCCCFVVVHFLLLWCWLVVVDMFCCCNCCLFVVVAAYLLLMLLFMCCSCVVVIVVLVVFFFFVVVVLASVAAAVARLTFAFVLGCFGLLFACLCFVWLKIPQNGIFPATSEILPLFSPKTPFFKIHLFVIPFVYPYYYVSSSSSSSY